MWFWLNFKSTETEKMHSYPQFQSVAFGYKKNRLVKEKPTLYGRELSLQMRTLMQLN